jgi:hypothetical protein
MLSQQIDHFQAALIERAEDILAGKAGPLVLDAPLLLRWAEIHEGWIEQAQGLEEGVVAPAARIHPQDLVGGNIRLLSDRRDAGKAVAR